MHKRIRSCVPVSNYTKKQEKAGQLRRKAWKGILPTGLFLRVGIRGRKRVPASAGPRSLSRSYQFVLVLAQPSALTRLWPMYECYYANVNGMKPEATLPSHREPELLYEIEQGARAAFALGSQLWHAHVRLCAVRYASGAQVPRRGDIRRRTQLRTTWYYRCFHASGSMRID